MTENKKENKEENKEIESPSFYGLGISPKILEILEQLKFTVPTPIQLKSIPVTIEGKDIVGIAQTGTGKTLAFGIPLIQGLAQNKGRGLILLPTRELALQVDDHLHAIAEKLGLKTIVLIGGEPINKQLRALTRKPQIIIATPGRLIDHLKRNSVNLDGVKILVLDEADLMFDMGFAPQIQEILKRAPKERQTMLFSATMETDVIKIATKYMSLPIRIETAPAGTVAEKVEHEMIIVKREGKLSQLKKILGDYSGSVLLFVRTKHGVKDLCREIRESGFSATEIHSNRSLFQRREALAGFKNGRFRILVATDIAARGIDVKGIELVLNYDLPDNLGDYVHRIGRTGRAGKAGRAISLALPSQINEIKKIERLINQNIPLTQLAQVFPEKTGPRNSRDRFRPNFRQTNSRQTGNFKPAGNFRKETDKPTTKTNAENIFYGQSPKNNRNDRNRKPAKNHQRRTDWKKPGASNQPRNSQARKRNYY